MRVLPILALLLLLGPVAPARAEGDGEDVRGPLPWHADEDTFLLRRIVDGATGRPVAGATVKLFTEVPHPEPGFGVPSAVATSDAGGWVRIQKDQLDPQRTAIYGEPSWDYVEAAGFGPNAEFGASTGGQDWELRPAAELRVTLHDPLGRPVVGAHVGWFLGCGHSPDLRHAVTDEHGVARLVGVEDEGDGQIWFVKEGFVSRYVHGEAWRPGTYERVARVEWGPVVTGMLFRHDGVPAQGVAVGRSDCHRGPWTRANDAGRFRLIGLAAAPGDVLFVEPDEYPVSAKGHPRTSLTLVVPLPGHDAVLRLPAPGSEPASEELLFPLTVDVTRGGADAQGLPVQVYAVRLTDGWTTDASAEPGAPASLDVRAGTYQLYARYAPEPSLAEPVPGPTVLVRADDAGASAKIQLPAPQMLQLRFEGSPLDVTTDVLVEGRVEGIHEWKSGQAVRVPLWPARPAFLRVDDGARVRITPLDPDRVNLVRDEPPVRVRARLVGPDGKPVRGWLLEQDRDEAGPPEDPDVKTLGPAGEQPVLQTMAGARVRFFAWPEDQAHLQGVRLPLREVVRPDLAAAGADAPIDLGEVHIPPRAQVVILEDVNGLALGDVTAIVTHGMRQERVHGEYAHHPALTIADPWYEPGLVVTGAVVRVVQWKATRPAGLPSEPWVYPVPFMRRLDGPGPWRVRVPTAYASLEVQASDGEPPQVTAVRVDGVDVFLRFSNHRDKVLALVGLEAGPHEVVVEAEEHLPRRFSFTLAEGEHRPLTARLTAAPPPR